MRLQGVLGVAVVSAVGAVARADVVFQDGVFAPANWTNIQVVGTGSSTSSQLLAGGNPGEAMEMTSTVNSGFGSLVRAFHPYGFTQATTYNPATQGAISSVAFSVDYFPVSGPPGGQGIALAFKQALVVYFALAIPGLNTAAWQTDAGTVTAADFTRADGLAGAPNFSAAGAPIRFGLLTYNSTGGDGVGFTTVADYDNYFVRIVPGPGTAWLAGAGVVVGMRRRRA